MPATGRRQKRGRGVTGYWLPASSSPPTVVKKAGFSEVIRRAGRRESGGHLTCRLTGERSESG